MEQTPLFHEDIYAATAHVVAALGGFKQAGHMLWPSLSPDNAGRKLANCLNGERPENLKPEELMQVFKEARKHGIHSGMDYLASECGYHCTPFEPEDEAAELQRQFIQSVKAQAEMLKRMERLNLPTAVRVAG